MTDIEYFHFRNFKWVPKKCIQNWDCFWISFTLPIAKITCACQRERAKV